MEDLDPYRAPRRRGMTGPLIALLLAFVAGIALTVVGVRHWDRIAALVRPQASAPAVMPQQIARPPAILVAQPPQPTADPALTARVDTIENRIQAIDDRAEEARGDADRAEGLLVAFAARRALDRGQPLGFLEGMLRSHFGGVEPQATAMVIGTAQRPVTLAQLQEKWAGIAPKTVSAVSGEGWWSGARRELGGLFVFHRADTPSAAPQDRGQRVARLLDQGLVANALDEAARLPAMPEVTQWIAAARRYVLARNALDRIETAALLQPVSYPPPQGEGGHPKDGGGVSPSR